MSPDAGDNCSKEGILDKDPQDKYLICQNGKWVVAEVVQPKPKRKNAPAVERPIEP